MSNKIYFTQVKATKDLKWYLVRTVAEIYRRIAPTSAAKRSRALLLSPHRLPVASIPEGIIEEEINTEYGQLMSYQTGSGPTVLFVHGWSGSGQQFFPLMNTIAQQGFTAISFDHFGHGQSAHTEANLPLLIKGINHVKNHYQLNSNLFAVVSHSLGAVASMNAFTKSTTPQYFIAPVFNFLEALYSLVINSGLPVVMLDDLITSIEAEHNVKIDSLDINDRIEEYQGLIHITHDKNDRLAKYRLSQKVVQTHPHIILKTTNQLGHLSILSASNVHDNVNDFLTLLQSGAAVTVKA